MSADRTASDVFMALYLLRADLVRLCDEAAGQILHPGDTPVVTVARLRRLLDRTA